MHGEAPALGYGLCPLVALNAALFLLFTLSFLAPTVRGILTDRGGVP